MEIDFWDRCRACLKVDAKKHNIFTDSYQGMSLQEILTFATSFQIRVDDGLSPFLCRSCVNLVTSFYNFKETYRKNESNIKALLLNLCVNTNPDDCPLEEIVIGDDNPAIGHKEPNVLIKVAVEELSKNEETDRIRPSSDEEYHGPNSDKAHVFEEDSKDYEEAEVKIRISSDEDDHGSRADEGHPTEDISSCPEKNYEESEPLADTTSFRPAENVEHLRAEKEKQKDIQCKTCNEIFNCDKDYELHLLIHKPNMCHICGASFRRNWDLKQHIASHLDKKTFVCKICGRAFKRRYSLTKHLSVHTDRRAYVCEHCGKAFKTRTTLNTHIRICHTKPLDCICTFCGAKFNLKSTLDKHMLRRHQERPREFHCTQCPSEFKDKGSLKRHVIVKHTDVKVFKPPCDVCGKEFWSYANLARHKKSVHEIVNKQRAKKSIKDEYPRQKKKRISETGS